MKAPRGGATQSPDLSGTLLIRLREAPRVAKAAEAKAAVESLLADATADTRAALLAALGTNEILAPLLQGIFEG